MGKGKVRWGPLSLYQKFALLILVIGLLPMMVLATFISNKMIRDYRAALTAQYEQAVGYVADSLDGLLDSYNAVSKLPYFYSGTNAEADVYLRDYLAYDKFRQMVYGVGYPPARMEQARAMEMETFMRYAAGVEPSINGVHFLAAGPDGAPLCFHYSYHSAYFKDEALFQEAVGYPALDRASNALILYPIHPAGYFSGLEEPVFTVARNYFDLRGAVGDYPYVGTLFLDIRPQKLDALFQSVSLGGGETLYVEDAQGRCFYRSGGEGETPADTEKWLTVRSAVTRYGLRVVALIDTAVAFQNIRHLQYTMYLVLVLSTLALLGSSVYFSRRLTHPIREMMAQMAQLENGNFDIRLPVRAGDEIGVLSGRFNQMSAALKEYINQSYVAQIKQREAELTALKSQIYPHFLYNTLEVIRMTALEDGEERVSAMIEALSEQIHYLIGPVQDVVPLEKEISNVKKYVYLLNCRIGGKVLLTVRAPGAGGLLVPKLILQPIVENAYVHGIKQKKGSGSISIEAQVCGGMLEVSVLDNGVGMDAQALKKLQTLLEGEAPGIKSADNWQSIGLKNVHDRIRLLYGADYGIALTSTPQVGTMVRLLMPAQYGEGNKNEDDIGR